MSSDSSVFTGENLNDYLKAVAKEYKKMGGKAMPAELILIGGAAVIANYGFREMTTDIDAIIHAASVMKDAINSDWRPIPLAKWVAKYGFYANCILFPKIRSVFYLLSDVWRYPECENCSG